MYTDTFRKTKIPPVFSNGRLNVKTVSVGEHSYTMIRAPEHPNARQGWIFLHRALQENKLGRYLQPSEQVPNTIGIKTGTRTSTSTTK